MRISQLASMQPAYYYNRSVASQNKSALKIASGKRILSAADDAAGVSQLMSLKAHRTTAKVAIDGLDSAREFANARDSALMQIADISNQLTELYASGKDDSDTTVAALTAEITAIGAMKFGDKDLFTSQTIGGITFGAITDMTAANFAKAKLTAGGDNENGKLLTANLGTLGGQMRGIDARRKINEATVENLDAAIGRIEEVDLAEETVNMNKAEIQASLASSIMGKQASSMKSILNLFA